MNEPITYPKTLLAMLERAQADNARLTAELETMTVDRNKWQNAANGWYENNRRWIQRWRNEREKNAWLQDRYDGLMGWHLGDDDEIDGDE
jgi:hypothetical protein